MKWYGTRTGINYPLSNNKKSNRVVSSGFLPWPIFFIFCSEFANIWSSRHHLCFVTLSTLINLGSTKKNLILSETKFSSSRRNYTN